MRDTVDYYGTLCEYLSTTTIIAGSISPIFVPTIHLYPSLIRDMQISASDAQ